MRASLPLAGGLIRQTTVAADWSVFYSFFSVVNRTIANFFLVDRPDGKLFLKPVFPFFHDLNSPRMFKMEMKLLQVDIVNSKKPSKYQMERLITLSTEPQ